MAKNKITLEVVGKADQAVAEMKKVAKAQDEVIKSLQKEVAESKKTADQSIAFYRKRVGESEKLQRAEVERLRHTIDKQQIANDKMNKGVSLFGAMKKGAGELMGALGVAGGVAGVIGGIVSSVQKWDQYMKSVASSSRQAGSEMTAFALLQDKGPMRQRVLQAAVMGAKYGRPMGETWDIVQAMQSLEGSFPAGMATAETIFQASKAGMDQQRVTEAVILGKNKGLTADKATYLPYKAGLISARSPEDLIKAAPALAFWNDPELMYAGGIELLKSVRPEQLETYLRGAGIGLSLETEKAGEMYKKLGLTGKSQIEKLRGLRAAGLDTAPKLQMAGIPDIEKSLGVATMVAALPEIEKNAATMRGEYSPGYAYKQFLGVSRTLPEVSYGQQVEQLQRTYEMEKVFGPQSPAAQRRDIRQLERAIKYQRQGYGFLVGEDMRVGPFAAAFKEALQQAFTTLNIPFGNPTAPDLRDNTEAIKNLSGTIAGKGNSRPVVNRPNRQPAGGY